MWSGIFLVFIALFTGTVMTQVTMQTASTSVRTEASAIAGNMQVYRNPVVTYAQANPGVTGAVSDATLSLPSWYSRLQGISNYVASGTGYVYYTGAVPELAYQILKSTNNSINVGIKQRGRLMNPLSTTNTSTPITLPSAIPEGSVVIAP